MRRFHFALCSIVLLCISSACSGDGGTNPFLSSDAGTGDDTSSPDVSPNNTSGDVGPGGCLGCLTAAGDCVDGDEQSACGAGGNACTTCGAAQVCSEAGVCVTAPTCTPDDCDGCCDAAGNCQPGDAETACGTGGLACSTCPADALCENGTCQRACGPNTCAGCCNDARECVGGTDDATCGTGGSDCAACAVDEGCSMGTCVSTACSDTCDGCCDGGTCVQSPGRTQCGADGAACVDCGAGRTCDAGACAVSPNSHWLVEVINGSVAATKPDGSSWDGFNGLPDPYVRFTMVDPRNGATYTEASESAPNTLSPSWEVTLLTDVPARALFDGITIEYLDDDAVFDDDICTMEVTLDADHAAFSGGIVESTCPDPSLGEVRWRLIAQ